MKKLLFLTKICVPQLLAFNTLYNLPLPIKQHRVFFLKPQKKPFLAEARWARPITFNLSELLYTDTMHPFFYKQKFIYLLSFSECNKSHKFSSAIYTPQPSYCPAPHHSAVPSQVFSSWEPFTSSHKTFNAYLFSQNHFAQTHILKPYLQSFSSNLFPTN